MIIGISIPSLIAILGGLMTYGYVNNVKVRHGFVQVADDIREHVLEVRRNEKNFLLLKDEEQLKQLKDAISILLNSINNISAETVEEIGKDDFSLLLNSIEAYSSPIDILFKNYQFEADVVEKVRAEGRKLETFASTGKHADELSLNFILNLRRLEKNYMLFRDKDSLFKLKEGLAQIRNITPFCYECGPYLKAINELFSVYRESDYLINTLQITGSKLEEITGIISNRERQHIQSFFGETQIILLITLTLLCTVGPLLVYKTASYIVAPIKRLVEITKKISEGDTSLRAPLKEHDETYSLALSFNTMLDHLQLTQQSLEETVHLLNEKQKEIEKRASLGFLISGVTHELNNPLNNISLTAETMKEELKELTHEELEDFIRDILTQSERAKHIIEDLLDFSGARKNTAMDKVDIINAVEEAINLVANELRVSNIQLSMNIPDKACFVKGIRTKLEEVFINIIINAIHEMKDKGSLTISAVPDTEKNTILIKISDTGGGIPEENIKNIFEPFFTTKDVGEGTGLGLSVSQGIIHDHKGEITVESKVGAGTTFIIELPLFEEAA